MCVLGLELSALIVIFDELNWVAVEGGDVVRCSANAHENTWAAGFGKGKQNKTAKK